VFEPMQKSGPPAEFVVFARWLVKTAALRRVSTCIMLAGDHAGGVRQGSLEYPSAMPALPAEANREEKKILVKCVAGCR
jgi:hypothetical protein